MNTENILNFLKSAGLDLLRGILVLVVGFFLVHWINKLLLRGEKLKSIDPTLGVFIRNVIRITLSVLVILTAVNIMGIPLPSVLTLVASGGVALSLALQGVLGNLIGGFILLLLRPFKVREYIKIGEYEGTVQNIGAFYTDLVTPDNRHLSLPNGTLTNTTIINYTREGTRRLDIPFSVSYESDLDTVYRVLKDLAASDPVVLKDPEPAVMMLKCADSGMDFAVRVWVKTADYWPVSFRLLDNGKRALDRAGITIPFPQMDVHVKS